MSGGNLQGYYNLERIADEIERLAIEQPELGPEVLGRYTTAVALCRAAFHAVKAVDYLDAGDYGRESFVDAWNEMVVPVIAKAVQA